MAKVLGTQIVGAITSRPFQGHKNTTSLREISTLDTYHFRWSKFGTTCSLRQSFNGQVWTPGTSSKSCQKELHTRLCAKIEDEVENTKSVQVAIPTPNDSRVEEKELEGLPTAKQMGILEYAVAGRERVLEQPANLESRGKGLGHPYKHLDVQPRWREIQGKDNWDGLLEPMDPVLRGEIIRYGEFAQAAYDAFDNDTHSKFCGSAKFHKDRLLDKVGLHSRGYTVTDYLYATSGVSHPIANFFKRIDIDDNDDWDADEIWDKDTNWMGFVAVATDEEEINRLGRRDIVIVWRGTVTRLEWLENLRDYLAPSAFDFDNHIGTQDIKIEAGFLNVYNSKNDESRYSKRSAREQVHEAVTRLIRKYKDDELSISVAGHSLGSALAHVCAYDLAENNFYYRPEDSHDIDHRIPISVFSFAGPRVGNDAFRDRMEELGVKVLRVVNKHDHVTKVPGLLLNEKFGEQLGFLWNWLERLPWTYTHCGVPLDIDSLVSPFLKQNKNVLNVHNLEAYLHLVNGYHGKGKDFLPALPRDIALVNKACDFLLSKHSIPANWWQEENKGLMRTEEGLWVPRLRDPSDHPEYEN